jgi:hypothetical protein
MKIEEKKIYSQNGEDGVIESIFREIGTTNRVFVEIGVGDGSENNTRHLVESGWSGLWVDKISPEEITVKPHGARYTKCMVNAENVNQVLSGDSVPKTFDLLSIDIDGVDYWVWKAIKYRPRVVVIEYNGLIPPPLSQVVPYDPNFAWEPLSTHFGASLSALHGLACKNGYSLLYCNGVNAFFVYGYSDGVSPEQAFKPLNAPCYVDRGKKMIEVPGTPP